MQILTALPDLSIPIVLFCYNRPWHLRQTLECLRLNTLAGTSELFIYSDGAKGDADRLSVREVREYLAGISGFKNVTVVASDANLGLAASVIKGVSEVISQYGKVIVLEDDMLTTPDFLEYMNEALEVYEPREDIFSVTAYTPPIAVPEQYKKDLYLAPRASSWGWGTWANRWHKADWAMHDFSNSNSKAAMRKNLNKGGDDLWPMLMKQQSGVIDSWAIRWTFAQMKNQAYGLYPIHSKIKNIGTDGSGTNFTFKTASYGHELSTGKVRMEAALQPDEQLVEAFRTYYNLPFSLKIKNWVKYRI